MNSSSSQQSSSTVESTQSSVRLKSDPAWAHFKEEVNKEGKKIWTCLHCNNVYKGGGINRMKKHLAGRRGEIAPCKKVPYDTRYQIEQFLKELDKKSEETNYVEDDSQYDPTIDLGEEIAPTIEKSKEMIPGCAASQNGKRKRNDKMSTFFAPRTVSGAQPSIKSALATKEALHNVDMAVARFFYDSCIPLNAINTPYFQKMVDAIAAIGPGYKAPKYYALRTNLLGSMISEVKLVIDNYRSIWEERGCTIMADGWQDQSNRQLINFLVYCNRGTTFVRSVDVSPIVKDASALCNLFVELVQWVGPSNVIHLITDNGANYKAAGNALNRKYPSISWSPCAAHCLNLLLGDIGKMELITNLATRASLVTKFIYNHAFLLAWLRKREGWTEIVRPGPTRFATTFIALKSILEHQHDFKHFSLAKHLKTLVTTKIRKQFLLL
ncbi:uncharacterized protein LOC126672970 [Mercurialis annua]|uniref:uncharacterized protein LOC126672970 n=1 Tax=Mercurialis annua TaxID=3986 RepID=UPI00215FAF9C|nr:uncharacterized protein LOC126672970 [Mercurialis annua]